MNFFVLGNEEGLPLEEVTGSYAGAMGLGQFMPSSYLEYAVDMDGDGRRDLWSSMPDIIGSVANYLHRHGWEPGQPVTYPAELSADADKSLFEKRDYKPATPVSELAAMGIASSQPISPDTLAAVVSLEEEDGDHYFVTFKNFYVITRYNRSPLYAMAVFELSEAIRKGYQQ
jgi:membrane-bound lytic murein transglycosylase B